MSARLTRVGRFIRNISLDDLPNLLNIIAGDMSLIGPRPTEPERVKLSDLTWQRILSVRPGNSPAILQLGNVYNRSPDAHKQQLELAYVEHHSFWYDLQLCAQFLWATLASRSNVKSRGAATAAITYTAAEVPAAVSAIPAVAPPIRWQLADRTGQDWQATTDFLRREQRAWPVDEPCCLLVPIDGETKPALGLRVAPGECTQQTEHELQSVAWVTVKSSRYVALGLTLLFTAGGREVATVLDVAAPSIIEWFAHWQRLDTPLPLFVLMDEAETAIHPYTLPPDSYPIQTLQATVQQLRNSQSAVGNFAGEKALLRQMLLSIIL